MHEITVRVPDEASHEEAEQLFNAVAALCGGFERKGWDAYVTMHAWPLMTKSAASYGAMRYARLAAEEAYGPHNDGTKTAALAEISQAFAAVAGILPEEQT